MENVVAIVLIGVVAGLLFVKFKGRKKPTGGAGGGEDFPPKDQYPK